MTEEVAEYIRRKTYKIIQKAADKVSIYASSVDMEIYVLDFDYPYNLFYQVTLKTDVGSAKNDVSEFLRYISYLQNVKITGQTIKKNGRSQTYIERT